MKCIKRALISVSDKQQILEFARKLNELGVEILSTGGTAELLAGRGIPVVPISSHTGFPEMMDGRIKTLHPKIHGGILGRRDVSSHMQAMREHDIKPIDLVVINLYPFEATIAREGCPFEDAIENIDIGGPAMIRSAAKNFNDVAVVVNPADYQAIMDELLANKGCLGRDTRFRLSRNAFAETARYDALISKYLTEKMPGAEPFPQRFLQPFEKIQDLRYGENPHQKAALYRNERPKPWDLVSARQLQGKELSYNNLLDLNAAWGLVTEFDSCAVAIIKHNNPCGAAVGDDQLSTFVRARETDPVSAFGGVLGFNRPVTAQTAGEILKNFVEAVIAPGFDPSALALFAPKKNIRLMEMPASFQSSGHLDFKPISGGLLVQDADQVTYDPAQLQVVTRKQPSPDQMRDLQFAWIVAKHVKSNAIVYARNNETVGIGAGQMSRVDSSRLAIEKAQKPIADCVMASDAFFPFRDSIDAAAKAGIAAIIQPGGSIRDKEVIDASDEHDMAMVFTGIRHFRH